MMMTDSPQLGGSRPRVSVVMPFSGDERAARSALARIRSVRLGEGDEAILVDNSVGRVTQALSPTEKDGVTTLVAAEERSSYYARNIGAEAADGDWLLFIDSDCVPPPDLIGRYLEDPPDGDVGMLAGPIHASAEQRGLLPEWAASRRILSQEASLSTERPAAATANVLVRSAAFHGIGGFLEGIRSGGDHDLSWRLAEAGWKIQGRPDAGVEHLHRSSLLGIARQMARYAAGNAWQRRKRPGLKHDSCRLVAACGSGAASIFLALTLRPRRSALRAVDSIAQFAQAGGALLSNSAHPDLGRDPGRLVIATDRFPVRTETFVTGEIAALRSLGCEVRVEAVERPSAPANAAARGLDVRYTEDESPARRALDTALTVIRHPLRSLGDVSSRATYRDEWLPFTSIAPLARRLSRGGERHVHVHFAALASVNALRAARIAGCTVSIAAHGHEVFRTPRNLEAKLASAAFIAAPCEYTAQYLREISPEARVEVVVMGVDGQRFRRRKPYPGGRNVLAIGRLVEKKGFAHLIEAAGALEKVAPLGQLVIVGGGPLEDDLRNLVGSMGLAGRVVLEGSLSYEDVRGRLDDADVLAMPCVIASDGDRDAMPVVVKEALASEVPVVASDEVGLPEVIRSEWGALVPPGDAQALASAIADLLAKPPPARARMGVSGRRFVLERFSATSQARKLLLLIDEVGA